MKINNNPNSYAIKEFTLPWDSHEDNMNIRSLEYAKVRSIKHDYNAIEMDLTTKYINEGSDMDSMSIEYDFMNFDKNNYEPLRFCIQEFSYFIIFVKEFNAYYKGEYNASWDGGLEDREVSNDALDFKLLPKGEVILDKYNFKKLAKKNLENWIKNYR